LAVGADVISFGWRVVHDSADQVVLVAEILEQLLKPAVKQFAQGRHCGRQVMIKLAENGDKVLNELKR